MNDRSQAILASLPTPTRPHASEDRILSFVEAIYDTLSDDELWAHVATRMNELVPVRWFTVSSIGPAFERANLQVSEGIDDAALRAYDEYFWETNPWIAEPFREILCMPGFTGAGHWVVSDEELERCEFGHDFLAPNDMFYGATSILDASPEIASNLGVYRPKSLGPYSTGEVSTIRVIAPHIRQALRVRARLLAGEGMAGSLEAVLDRVTVGAVLLDLDGRALQFNRRAKELFGADDGLTLTARGTITAARPDDARKLAEAVAEATASADGRGLSPGRSLAIPRPSGGHPHMLQIAPLRVDASRVQAAGAARAVVFIADPDHETKPPEEQLQSLYGLTRAEARLAVRLAEGRSVSEAAEMLHIQVGTARQHLKRIFSKTGARRQAELIRLLLAGTFPVRADA